MPGVHGGAGRRRADGAVLACAACGHAYDVRHAGRCMDDDGLHLEPVPLLVGGDGMVRVALGAPA